MRRIGSGRGARLRSVVAATLVGVLSATVVSCGGATSSASVAAPTTGSAKPAKPTPKLLAQGRSVFKASCASCHTLADAKTHGTVGPNLDKLKPKPTLARVLSQVKQGGGFMPSFSGTLSAAKVKAVATYVFTVSGKKKKK